MAEATVYRYRAVNTDGKELSGELRAKSEQEVVALLREQGRTPIEVKAKEQTSKNIQLTKKKVKKTDLAVFCRQMATMLRAGLALDRAMSVQILQTENKTLYDALAQVDNSIKRGSSFAKALAEHPDIFPKLLVKMVDAGEMTGGLDAALDRMALQLEKDNRVNNRIRGAMIYPIILLSVTIIVVILMMIFVIPTFTELFTSADMELPGITQVVVNISTAMKTYWYIFLAVAIAIVYGVRLFLGSKGGRMQFDTWKLRLPKIKQSMSMIVTARFTRTLSTLLSSGISLIEAMNSAAETCNNVLVVERVALASEGVKKGEPLAGELRKAEVFPVMMLSMIGIGEETGDLDGMLQKTAEYYDEMFDTAVQRLLAVMEPLLIVLMAVVVGFVVISLYVPLFSMYDAIG